MVGHQIGTGDGTWSALERVVSDVQAARVQIARLQAEEARLLADAADIVRAREGERRLMGRSTVHDLALREVSSELGAAMRLSDRSVQARMSAASSLVDGFAETHRALAEGGIDHAHAAAIVDCGVGLLDETMRGEYERILLEAAEFETPPRLRAIARIVAARIDPEMAAELQRRAHSTRRVRVIDLEDGMARLLADLPAVLAYAILDRLTQMAEIEDEADRAAAAAAVVAVGLDAVPDAAGEVGPERPVEGSEPPLSTVDEAVPADRSDEGECAAELSTAPGAEQRSRDELRADIFADLLLTGAPAAHGAGGALASIRAEVQITVPVLTAAGKDDEPALLTGYGPIDNEMARELAAGAPGWDRVMYHPHTGLPMAVDRYRPSAELRRFLRARDERCRFPGCTRRPSRCDVDHTLDHAKGGTTSECNLAHFCPRHHTVKHATAWRVRQAGGGVLEWFSPTGRRYLDRPPSVVQFVPSRTYERLLSMPYVGDAPF
ncbi:HNH endonuclease signature motif containing protein [Microbacterium jejuense]|uniref:HNH endonuclease signature motif containing protein n=1 Tax=Microbacterium jejuense TaxID=1263637 RepID=UPI0031E5ED56